MSEYKKKLIEVALPLEEINAACKADKDRKTGTIRNLHKWFAPMPLPAWRALIYAALIDDPVDDERRAYHLDLIKRLVANGADLPEKEVIDEAQQNIASEFPDGVPAVMDPFCGGGSTLVEAQRLGLETFGSDLNPVPVLISRILTQLLPRVHGGQPLIAKNSQRENDGGFSIESPIRRYAGYEGLISDVMHYGELVGKAAESELLRYYPSESGELPAAWLWARTAPCPNPACGLETVLATSWWVSKKKGELAWIVPSVKGGKVTLDVLDRQLTGEAPASPKAGHGSSFTCIGCDGLVTDKYLQEVGSLGQLGLRMTAVAVERADGRGYRAATEADQAGIEAVDAGLVDNIGQISLGDANQYTSPPRFGFRNQADLYTVRQRLKMLTFARLVASIRSQVLIDGGSPDWADAVVSLLGLAVGKLAQYDSTQGRWLLRTMAQGKAVSAFDRGDYPMMWDFAETNFMGGSVGDWKATLTTEMRSLKYVPSGIGEVIKVDARVSCMPTPGLVATDPPYFDAIAYADLSDFFYVWHRIALREVHPDLYATAATPKSGELTAFPWHHDGTKEGARKYFIDGFTETFKSLKKSLHPELPLLVVYASKEQKGGVGEETRWSSILTAMINADLEITGTWPIHGTGTARMRGIGSNAVATYVVMVARPRPISAGTCSLQDFNRSLRIKLKGAVQELQSAGILPVDLAQAAMGPGMEVYSRFRAVLDQSGEHVSVNMALKLINDALGEVLDEQDGELEPYSRFAVAWWQKHHWSEARFGEADQLARPYGISVDDVIRAGVASYPKPGFVRVEGNEHLIRNWEPSLDVRPTAWEAVHHLIDRLIDGGGVSEAGALMGKLGPLRDPSQGLVYRLHAIAAKKGWTKDQERYNALIGSWSDLLAEAGRVHKEEGLF